MKKLMFLLLFPTSLFAQDNKGFFDTLTVEEEGYGIAITYYNSAHRVSANKEEEGELNGIKYYYEVKISTIGPEILTVKSLTDGYEVIPKEVTPVEDGQTVTIYIMPVTG